MNKAEFIKIAVESGYADKKTITEYVELTNQERYDTNDLIKVHRMLDINHHNPLITSKIENGKKSNNAGFKS